jgi:hypothetical protein
MACCLTIPPFRPFLCRIASELLPGRMRPTRSSGSFQAGPLLRWRRRPETRQQNSPKTRLTRLTESTHRLTGAGYAEAMA